MANEWTNENQTTANQAPRARKSRAAQVPSETFDLDLAQSMAESEGFANLPHPDANPRKRRSLSTTEQLRERWNDARSLFNRRGSAIFGTAKDAASRVSQSATDKWRELPADTRELAGKIDTHARANPWLHIGIASAGGLIVGYAAGRILASKSKAPNAAVRGYDFDQSTDE